MNIEDTKKAIEVMQAYVDGAQIQVYTNGKWIDFGYPTGSPEWNFAVRLYRVKPEPLECWVTVFNDHVCSTCHDSKESASHITDSPNWTARKFREVIE